LSLKENLEMVKEELNQEEKFFENAVKAERFFTKYKTALIGGVVVVVLGIVGGSIYQANQESKIAAANVAFNTLSANADDKTAQAELKKLSPDLYDVWVLSQALVNKDAKSLKALTHSSAVAVSDIATYELAAIENDSAALNSYAYKQDAIYKDLALVEASVLLMQKNEMAQAHEKLDLIENDSPMYKVSRLLMHYGAK